MIKKYVLGLCSILGYTAYAQQVPFTIHGKLDNPTKDQRVVLAYRAGHYNVSDTTGADKGSFHFEGSITGPIAAKLILLHNAGAKQNDDILKIYLDETPIDIQVQDSLNKASMQGSNLNKEYQQYLNFLKEPDTELEQVEQKWKALDETGRDKFWFERDNRTRAAQANKKKLMLDFAKQYPDSYFSLRSLMILCTQDVDAPMIKPVFELLSAELRNTVEGVKLHERIVLANKTVVGAIAPDFVQNDLDDQPVRLSDFRGKYVLLDFWASWCGPCRAENPNLVKAYATYKDKNFTILGVSLDYPGKKELWAKAVKADGLLWPQVSDLNGWSNKAAKLYSITGVPQNFLIDPQGKIVAKNLKGEQLHEYLESVLAR